MKNYLLLAVTVILFCCKSKTKTEETVSADKSKDTIYAPAKDTAQSVNIVPESKLDIETFGDIKLGQPSAETIKVLGEPTAKSKATEWAADGLMHQDWTWKDKGLVINMSYDKANAESTRVIFIITAKAPCSFKTKAGLGIGSSYAEVQTAYKKDIDPEATDKTQITVGSVYGGIIFSFENDKASSIFLGAQSE